AGATPDPARAKVLVESLSEVKIEEVLKQAVAAPVAAAQRLQQRQRKRNPRKKRRKRRRKKKRRQPWLGLALSLDKRGAPLWGDSKESPSL
ncbi:MAG: hypothetical protein DRN90_02395, partial [Thermoproteota archaeon]